MTCDMSKHVGAMKLFLCQWFKPILNKNDIISAFVGVW
jgi:hypothetical protein